MADMQMQVWLDTIAGTRPTVVVPYVKTDHDARLTYRMKVLKAGKSGYSAINQSGTVSATAGTPKALSQLSVGLQQGDDCHIDIELLEGGQVRGTYRFECPR